MVGATFRENSLKHIGVHRCLPHRQGRICSTVESSNELQSLQALCALDLADGGANLMPRDKPLDHKWRLHLTVNLKWIQVGRAVVDFFSLKIKHPLSAVVLLNVPAQSTLGSGNICSCAMARNTMVPVSSHSSNFFPVSESETEEAESHPGLHFSTMACRDDSAICSTTLDNSPVLGNAATGE